jgi:uncharacterized membrane protein
MHISVIVQSEGELPEIVAALGCTSGFAGLLNGGEQ